jgi:hypothetical protein
METMTGMYADNDGRFPDETPVLVKCPLTVEQENGDRKDWPWLPGKLAATRRALAAGPTKWTYKDGKDLCSKCSDQQSGRSV